MLRIQDRERLVKFVRDPHHNGCTEWALINGKFYSRQWGSTSDWYICKRFHATPARVKALASLLES